MGPALQPPRPRARESRGVEFNWLHKQWVLFGNGGWGRKKFAQTNGWTRRAC